MPELTALASEIFDYTDDNILVSPDGRFLSLGATIVTSMGMSIRSLKRQTPVQWAADDSVIVRNDNSTHNSILTLTELMSSIHSTGRQMASDDVAAQPTCFLSPSRLYTIADWYPGDPQNDERTHVTLEERSPLDNKVIRSIRIPLPVKSAILNVVFSPRGDQMLWQLQRRSVSPFEAIVRRFLPQGVSGAYSLWVCKIDGSNMHEIGTYEIRHDTVEDDSSSVAMLSWLPDARHFSFIYRNKLYTVPTN